MGVAQGLQPQPAQVQGAGDGQRVAHGGAVQQQGETGEAERGPGGIAHQRADLHHQRRLVAAPQAAPQGFAEDCAGRGVEHQAEEHGGDEEGQHGRKLLVIGVAVCCRR
ncbi:hypothetical protein D9M68_920210 [compost metagenome]